MSLATRIKNIRKTKDPRKVIAKAATLFENEPERWTKGSWIEDDKGVTWGSDQYFNSTDTCEIGGICKVCLEGALLIYAKDNATYHQALKIVEKALGGRAPYSFNDDLGYSNGPQAVAVALRGSLEK